MYKFAQSQFDDTSAQLVALQIAYYSQQAVTAHVGTLEPLVERRRRIRPSQPPLCFWRVLGR